MEGEDFVDGLRTCALCPGERIFVQVLELRDGCDIELLEDVPASGAEIGGIEGVVGLNCIGAGDIHFSILGVIGLDPFLGRVRGS